MLSRRVTRSSVLARSMGAVQAVRDHFRAPNAFLNGGSVRGVSLDVSAEPSVVETLQAIKVRWERVNAAVERIIGSETTLVAVAGQRSHRRKWPRLSRARHDGPDNSCCRRRLRRGMWSWRRNSPGWRSGSRRTSGHSRRPTTSTRTWPRRSTTPQRFAEKYSTVKERRCASPERRSRRRGTAQRSPRSRNALRSSMPALARSLRTRSVSALRSSRVARSMPKGNRSTPTRQEACAKRIIVTFWAADFRHACLRVSRAARIHRAREDARGRAHDSEGQAQPERILRLLNEMGNTLADGDLTVQASVTEDVTGAIAELDQLHHRGIAHAGQRHRFPQPISSDESDAGGHKQSRIACSKHRSGGEQGNPARVRVGVDDGAVDLRGRAERRAIGEGRQSAAEKGGSAVQNQIAGMNEIRTQETSKRDRASRRIVAQSRNRRADFGHYRANERVGVERRRCSIRR